MMDLFDWKHPEGKPKSKAQAALDMQTGIDNVEQGAGEEWIAGATEFLRRYAEVATQDFLAEQVVAACPLPVPHDGRAWGPVFMRARRAGWIQKVGYAPSASSNLSPKCLWRSAT